jgi:hypothetical protein
MQQQELNQIRQKEANMTALAAIGPRKKRKMESPVNGAGAEVEYHDRYSRLDHCLYIALNRDPNVWIDSGLCIHMFLKINMNVPFSCLPLPLRRVLALVPRRRVGPIVEAPDLSASASPGSTSGTCSSVWRMREKPVAHIYSTKASSNNTQGDETLNERNQSL